jgi:hypothetical protein
MEPDISQNSIIESDRFDACDREVLWGYCATDLCEQQKVLDIRVCPGLAPFLDCLIMLARQIVLYNQVRRVQFRFLQCAGGLVDGR